MKQPQNDVVAQLSLILMLIYQALQLLLQNQATPTPAPSSVAASLPPIVEPIRKELPQGVTLNADNLSAAQRFVCIAEERTIFVTKAELEALV